jgi:glyoxylase-like metal-dependent hydrolase (beta-lactamase superfamily II)
MSSQTIWQLAEKLYLIALTPPLQGFDRFIGIWLHTGPPAFLVDVGPAATTASLLKALGDLGIRHLDYLLLTHIHIDHAGGIGEVAAAFPHAQIVCHAQGLPHLIQPERLWEGSLRSLGPQAEAYGAISAVAPDRVTDAATLDDPRIRIIPTPGHAPHHISYAVDDLLFAGEAGGVCLATRRQEPYMRPATPPRFFLDVALGSLDRLIAQGLSKIAYSHFGLFADAQTLLQSHRLQLLLWEQLIGQSLADTETDDLPRVCLERLLCEDARLAAYAAMTTQERRREEGFLSNSIQGFIGYLQRTPIEASGRKQQTTAPHQAV